MAAAVASYMSNGVHRSNESTFHQYTSAVDRRTTVNGGQSSRHASWRVPTVTKSDASNASGSAKMAETVSLLKSRCAEELGAAISNNIVSSHTRLMEKISQERLRALPTEGSAWDKVLAWAQSFAEKFNDFDHAIEQFTGGNYDGAEIAFGYCILLLELGDENAAALQTSFGFFFKCSLDLIAMLDRVELFNASFDINEQLVLAYADLVTLVSDIALQFYQAIRAPSKSGVSIDIYAVFAGTIESFQNRRDKIIESMWKYQLSQANVEIDSVASIKTLRSWLAIEDNVLKYKSGDHTTLVNDRQQLTCLWVQPYLTRFLNSGRDALSITGPAGSGKTVLAGTIVDTVQRNNSRKSYTVLFVPINARTKSQATSLHVIRNLLSQLLESRVGDVELYKVLSETFEASYKAPDVATYESLLWKAFEKAIGLTLPQAKDTLIIVDGIDEVSDDPKEAQNLHKNLVAASSKHEKVKLITLSQPSSLVPKAVADVQITSDLVYDDVFSVVSTLLQDHPFLRQQSRIEQEIIVDQIVESSKSNFLWSKLVAKSLLKESSLEKFRDAAAALKKNPKPLQEVIRDHLTSTNLSEEGKQLLIWLTISKRPLSVEELSLLYGIDPKTGSLSGNRIDPLHVLKPVASLVFLQDGLFYLRHATIRNALASHFEHNKQQLPVREPSLDLVRRLLAYLRVAIKDQRDPSFSSLTPGQIDQVFSQHPLAEYAIRYWPSHYLELSTSAREISQEVKREFNSILPTSPTVPLLEKSAWTWQPGSIQALWHTTSLEVFRKVFDDNHPVILQSTILLAVILQKIGNAQSAAKHSYFATKLSATTFSITHPLTIQCANHFLDVSSIIKFTTRSETTTYIEEVLSILIQSYTKQYGATSEMVTQYQYRLVELYRSLKEETKAIELEHSIRGRSVQGGQDELTRRKTGSLDVRVMFRQGKETGYKNWDWNAENDYDISIQSESSKSIDELIVLAQTFASKGFTAKAEQCYIEAWYHISLQRKAHQSLNMDVKRIKLAVTYATFLKSSKREAEASALLTGVWEEYRSSSVALSEEISSRLFEVGQTLKTLGVTSVALEIFKHHSSVVSTHHKQESSSRSEVEEYLHATQRELLKQVSSSSASVSHVSRSEITEIITSIESSKSSQLDVTSTSAVKRVVTTYIAQKRWKDATVVIKQTLRIIWESLFAASIEDVSQPVGNSDFAIELADQLIVVYESRLRIVKAQDLRERLYRAVKSTRKIDDSVVKHNLSELFRIYEKNRAREKIIQLHRDLLEDYRKAYGPTHQVTLQTLWKLAQLSSPDPISIDYYREIVELLSKDSAICHVDAIEALRIISNHYWSERRYRDAAWAYALLFDTYVQKGRELKQFHHTDFVSTIYTRYVDSLKVSSFKTAAIYEITKRYRETCITVFGTDSKISHEATLSLARLCQSTKRHEAEAITLYEQLVKDAKATEYHSECRETLDAIYEEKSLEAARSTSVSASSEQIDHAVTIIRKRMTENRSHYGWTHEESLEQLKEMSYLYAKRSKKEEAVKEITETTSHILSSEKSSVLLVKSASAIAASYFAVSETHRGLELAEELRWQLITKDASNSKKYNINLTTADRSAAIFIAQLEHSLRQDLLVTFSETYLSILTEIVYYEDFQRSIRSNSSVEEVFSIAARLHSFLSHQKRFVIMAHVEDELASFFLRMSGEKAKVGDIAQVKILVTTMLEYLHTRQVKKFLHSINLAAIERVRHFLEKGQNKQACDLAQTAFRYCHANGWYSTADAIKHGLVQAITIADLGKVGATRKAQIEIASSIIRPMLKAAQQLNLNLAAIPLIQTNSIVSILGEQKDFETLEVSRESPLSCPVSKIYANEFVLQWLLTTLWDARETHRAWRPSVVLALGRRLAFARFLLNKQDLALHLAADIAYNLRRVYGSSHLATLEMNIFLSQLYVSTGLALQSTKGAGDLAPRYYKRAIGVHENVLRSLTLDPLGLNEDDDVTVLSSDPEPLELSGVVSKDASQGTYARRHLVLLKLALERFGDFPKGYAEYEQLNADVFHTFSEDLRNVDGVEKWNIKKYGNGKAESDEGALDVNVKDWALIEEHVNGTNGHMNGNGVD